MTFRVLPPVVFSGLFRLYAIAAGWGLAFAALFMFLGSGPFRVTNAALSATLCAALGAIYVGYVVGSFFLASGVARWKVNATLVVLTALPAALLFASPLWGSLLFIFGFPLVLHSLVARPGTDGRVP